jgi:ABC-type transport system involved in multi-copper enzyme maturation permease subunit
MVALPLLIALGIQAGDHVLRIIAPDWPQLAENLIANPLIQRSLATIALAHPLSPMFLLIMSMQAFGSAPIPINYLFPALIIIHLSMAGCFIVWSSRRLRKAHRAQETRAAQKSQKDSGQNLTPRRSRHVYDWSPLFWKEIAVGKGRRTTLLVRILLFLGIAVFYYNVIDQGLNRGFHDNDMRLSLSMGSVLLVGIGFLMVAFRSASSIGEERDRDCWVSLLAAPVTASEIVRAKVFGSLQPLGLYLLLVSPLLIISLLIGTLSIIGLAMWLAVVGIYGTLISSIGVYHSLCQKTTMRAIGVTLITCASFCGVGQAFLLPILMWDDNTGQLIAGSMPWVALVCAANLNNFRSDMDHEVVFWVIVFLVGYLLVSLGIIARTIGIFGRITERYDTPQQPAGEPRPPLPPTSSLPSPASP